MSTGPRPTKADLLEEIATTCHVPRAAVELVATRWGDVDFPGLAPAQEQELRAEVGEGRDGFAVDVARRWKLEAVAGVTVTIAAGYDHAQALAELERITAELRARPGILSADWETPLVGPRPALRVVKPAGS